MNCSGSYPETGLSVSQDVMSMSSDPMNSYGPFDIT